MARRRMISLDVIDTDLFIDMPVTSRLLYYELCIRADDDGFVGSPKKIQSIVKCSDDDFKVLITKNFIIPFENGVIVIRDWKVHNYIPKDRYKPTIYQKEMKLLNIDCNGSYSIDSEACIQPVYKLDTQVRLGKDRLGKDRLGKSNQLANADSFAQSQKYLNNINQDINKVTLFYEQNIGLLSPFILEEIEEYQSQISDDMIIEAIKRAVEAGKRNWKYTKGIINNWISQGIKTLAEVQQNDEAFKKAKETKQSKIIIETPEQEKERLLKEQEEYLKRKAERERKEAEKKAKEEAKMFQIHEDRKEKKVVNKEAINEVMNIFKNSTNK